MPASVGEDGVPRRPVVARWWASVGLALVVAVVVGTAGHAVGLDFAATAALVAAVTTIVVGGLHVVARRGRDARADLRELAEGRLEPTAPSATAVIGVGLFVFDQVAAAVITPLQDASADITPLAVLSSYALPAAAAFALATWAGRFSDRPMLAVLAGSGIAVLLDTVVLLAALGVAPTSPGVVPLVVGYWTVRGAVLLVGGMAGAVIAMRGRETFLAKREARLTAALGRGSGVGDRP